MSTDKNQELARDVAREQYTDDPDDPHWWDDEDEDDITIDEKREYLVNCGYPKSSIDKLDDEAVERWYKEELEAQNEPEEDEPRSLYEKYPLDSSYYQTAM